MENFFLKILYIIVAFIHENITPLIFITFFVLYLFLHLIELFLKFRYFVFTHFYFWSDFFSFCFEIIIIISLFISLIITWLYIFQFIIFKPCFGQQASAMQQVFQPSDYKIIFVKEFYKQLLYHSEVQNIMNKYSLLDITQSWAKDPNIYKNNINLNRAIAHMTSTEIYANSSNNDIISLTTSLTTKKYTHFKDISAEIEATKIGLSLDKTKTQYAFNYLNVYNTQKNMEHINSLSQEQLIHLNYVVAQKNILRSYCFDPQINRYQAFEDITEISNFCLELNQNPTLELGKLASSLNHLSDSDRAAIVEYASYIAHEKACEEINPTDDIRLHVDNMMKKIKESSGTQETLLELKKIKWI